MRDPGKTLYTLLLTAVLIAGCLNSGSSADSDDEDEDETHGQNSPPIVDAHLVAMEPFYAIDEITTTTEETEGGTTTTVVTVTNQTVITGYNLSLYHAMSDWDGTISTAGWDVDLDGSIDAVATGSTGITTVFYTLPDFEVETQGLVTLAFGAQDDDGAWSSGGMVTFNIFSDVTSDLALSPIARTTTNIYTAEDSAASISAGTDDTLMSIRWQHAEDELNWAFVVMKLTVGDNTFDCSTDGTEECAIAQDGSDAGVWETGEFLTLSETVDICGGAGEVTCQVDLYVTYRGTAVAGTDNLALS